MSGLWDSVPNNDNSPFKELYFDFTRNYFPLDDEYFERVVAKMIDPYRIQVKQEELDFIVD